MQSVVEESIIICCCSWFQVIQNLFGSRETFPEISLSRGCSAAGVPVGKAKAAGRGTASEGRPRPRRLECERAREREREESRRPSLCFRDGGLG